MPEVYPDLRLRRSSLEDQKESYGSVSTSLAEPFYPHLLRHDLADTRGIGLQEEATFQLHFLLRGRIAVLQVEWCPAQYGIKL